MGRGGELTEEEKGCGFGSKMRSWGRRIPPIQCRHWALALPSHTYLGSLNSLKRMRHRSIWPPSPPNPSHHRLWQPNWRVHCRWGHLFQILWCVWFGFNLWLQWLWVMFKIYEFNFWLIFKISRFSFWFGFMFKNSGFTSLFFLFIYLFIFLR